MTTTTTFEPLSPGNSVDSINIDLSLLPSSHSSEENARLQNVSIVPDGIDQKTLSRETSSEHSGLFSSFAAIIEPLTRSSSSNDSLNSSKSSGKTGRSGRLLVHIPSLTDLFANMWPQRGNGTAPVTPISGTTTEEHSRSTSRANLFETYSSRPSSLRCTSPTDVTVEKISPSMLLRSKMKKNATW